MPDLSVKEVAQQLGRSEQFVRALVKRKEITFFRLGKYYLFRPEWVTEYVARNTFGPDAEGGAK